jgi:hypothetical protein
MYVSYVQVRWVETAQRGPKLAGKVGFNKYFMEPTFFCGFSCTNTSGRIPPHV